MKEDPVTGIHGSRRKCYVDGCLSGFVVVLVEGTKVLQPSHSRRGTPIRVPRYVVRLRQHWVNERGTNSDQPGESNVGRDNQAMGRLDQDLVDLGQEEGGRGGELGG